jgi:hypothetical protein
VTSVITGLDYLGFDSVIWRWRTNCKLTPPLHLRRSRCGSVISAFAQSWRQALHCSSNIGQ